MMVVRQRACKREKIKSRIVNKHIKQVSDKHTHIGIDWRLSYYTNRLRNDL